MKTCNYEGCTNKHKGHGYCQTHLARLKRNGDLEVHYAAKHNAKGKPEYKAWENMKRRCYTPSASFYRDYGGRGIKVCDRWLNSFANFYADMGDKPSPKHSIDRIDNNGNYEPSNCRWATIYEQLTNQRLRKDNTSGHKNIYPYKYGQGGYIVNVSRYKDHRYLGVYKTLEEAIAVRDKYINDCKEVLQSDE